MKRKKLLIRIGILSAVFIAALFVSSMITNQGTTDLAVDMSTASLPRVKFLVNDKEVNALVGYRDEMDIPTMRDSITPVEDDLVLDMVLERHDNSIDQIRYEVFSLNGQEVYKEGTASEANGIVPLDLKDVFRKESEVALKVTLTMGEKTANYYTRLVLAEELHASECLDFAQQFHADTFAKETTRLSAYLEPGEDGGQSSFQTVTITSDVFHVMWGDLAPELVRDAQWDIKESNSTYTSILATYQVTCPPESGDGADELYNVREFFRVRWLRGELYLLDYNRTMNQVFDGASQVLTETGIDLGLAPSDLLYMTNRDGTIVSFVQERDLWTYDQANDALSLVFSFSNTEGDDIRNWYDQHRIRILAVDDNGSTTFAVYGYMNRGRHEGHVGVDIFYFDIETNSLEEKAFIPSTKSFAIAEDELGHMVYYRNSDSILYVLTGGILYEVDLNTHSQKRLAENLKEEQYVVSDDGHLLAYQTNDGEDSLSSLQILNLETGEEQTVDGKSGEIIRPCGFIGNDLVYGLAKPGDTGRTITGEEILPMYRLEIRDTGNEVVETYEMENGFISDTIVEENMVTINRLVRNGDVYTGTSQDYITSNEEREKSNISLESYTTEKKERQMRLAYMLGISDQDPKLLKPKQVALEGVLTIAFDSEMPEEKYYVYGTGELAGIYGKASYAIQKAEALSGVVISSSQTYIWEKGNRDEAFDTGAGALNADGRSPLEACRDYMAQYDAKEVDLSGCTIEQILYIINKGLPVIAVLDEDQAILLTAYDAETVTYSDPSTGQRHVFSYADMDQLCAPAGNTFLGYIR